MNFLFDSWESLWRTFSIGTMAYLSLIVMLRASGKRTLSKMNAFDFIVTVALGSCLANVILNKELAMLDGLLGFFVLIFLQFLFTWMSVRWLFIKQLITSQPTLIFYKGKMISKSMKRERITEEELFMKLRKKGISDMSKVDAIVLETTGELTIIKNIKNSSRVLLDVKAGAIT
jgi:uncharacterized membrane protein YcaP (DUF421 family)